MIEVFPNLRKHLRSGEKVLWTGQPVPSKEYKTLRPILALLTLVIIAFVFLTVYQYYQAVQINPSFLNFDNMLRSLFDHSELRDVGFAFLATLFLLLFRLVLPHIINEDNKTIYAITNQRLMVIEPGKDPELKDYGPGEVQDPSIVKRGKSSGDLLFAAQVKQVGEVKDRGQTRREISWEGFFNVDDLDNAHQQLTEWRKKYAGIGRLVNKELSMEITVPPNWTSQPFYVDKGFRDNVFFSMLASEIMGESRPTLRSADYNEPWNTLLLTHQGFSHADQSDAQVHHFKILVEGAISADEPHGVVRVIKDSHSDLDELIGDPKTLYNVLKEHLLICEFTNLQKINKKEKSYQLQLHSEAAVPEKPYHDLPTYEMIGTLGILGRVYKYKQVYCYQVGIPYKDQNRYLENVPEKFTLHLRFTFFCLEKLFKKNQHLLDVVVKSAKLISVEDEKSKQQTETREIQTSSANQK